MSVFATIDVLDMVTHPRVKEGLTEKWSTEIWESYGKMRPGVR
jgi:hypothetical protein